MKFNDKQFSIYNGEKLKIEVFGASHASEIGVRVDGLKGYSVDFNELQAFMERRRAKNKEYSTKRIEQDKVIVKSGVTNGVFNGDTFEAVIENTNQRSSDYEKTKKIPRPSHADYVAWSKYGDGFDFRGGGKFSGRLTAPMCIIGGVCKQILLDKGISVNAYISSIGSVLGKSYKNTDIERIDFDNVSKEFPLLDSHSESIMREEIERARAKGDSVGGTIECVIKGVPVGTGEYMFDSIESIISHLAFAVPAVKGIEFGSGFDLSKMHGSTANDPYYYDGDKVKTLTNNNGGINGGIANGMPITFRVAIKPTPSIAIEQKTVDLVNKTDTMLKIIGRHDACIVPRAVPVIEAIASIAILDII